MDKATRGQEAPEEVTRESLISISYCEPEKTFLPAKLLSGKSNGEALVGSIDSDADEKFRSELISISYTESPEVGRLPVAMAGLNN